MYRDDVARQVQSVSKYTPTIRRLAERFPALAVYQDAPALIAALRNTEIDNGEKNAALLALIHAYQANGRHDCGAFSLLMAAMFPVLDQIFITRTRGVPRRKHDEVWSEIVIAFAE